MLSELRMVPAPPAARFGLPRASAAGSPAPGLVDPRLSTAFAERQGLASTGRESPSRRDGARGKAKEMVG